MTFFTRPAAQNVSSESRLTKPFIYSILINEVGGGVSARGPSGSVGTQYVAPYEEGWSIFKDPLNTGFQEKSSGGRWSWTLKFAQRGRWSWTLKFAQRGRWSWTLKFAQRGEVELDPQVRPAGEVELGCEIWISFASGCSSTAVQRTLSL